MRKILFSLTLLLPLVLVGCARFPEGGGNVDIPPRTLYAEMTVKGEINPSYYYFLALGRDQTGDTGPLPIVTGPELGNGWGTIGPLGPNDPIVEPPFYVMYHNGTFSQYRVPAGGTAAELIADQPQPYRYGVSEDRKTIYVEIDQRLLGDPIPRAVQLNWITQEVIDTPPQSVGLKKQYDGFGPDGNDYLDFIELDYSQRLVNGENGIVEQRNDGTTAIDDIDMENWRVEVRVNTTGEAL